MAKSIGPLAVANLMAGAANKKSKPKAIDEDESLDAQGVPTTMAKSKPKKQKPPMPAKGAFPKGPSFGK